MYSEKRRVLISVRYAKLLLLLFFLSVFPARPSYSIDPFRENTSGFGPRVAGTRLGMKMSLRDIVRWRANLRGVPFTLEINSERIPGKKPSETGSMSILFTGKDKEITEFRIVSAARGFYRLKNENMKLLDLLAEIEKAGVETVNFRGTNTRITEDCISFTDDMRVASIRIRQSDLDAKNMTHENFVNMITEMYSLPEMRRRGNFWNYTNDSEGWQITYQGLGDGILELSPEITE